MDALHETRGDATIGPMRCPRCGHENARGTATCQGCKKVRFVAKSSARSQAAVKPPSKAKQAALKKSRLHKTSSHKTSSHKPASKKRHLLVRVGAPPLELTTDTVFTIGRGHKCSLSIDSNRVSRVHAVIKYEDGKLVLSDRGSANGTFVSGKPIMDHTLVEGDEISIGPFTGVYRFADPAVVEVPPTSYGQTVIEKGDLMRGQIGDGALGEVLQSVEFHRKTGTLFVFSLAGQGWITFVKGAPHAAESGAWEGAEAVFQLLALKEGRFSFTNELRVPERRMKVPITGLLIEWGRRADEAAR
jgi:hypothetical protein